MRLLIIYQQSQRGWGERIAKFVAGRAPEDWQVDNFQIPLLNQPVIDDPAQFMPPDLPATDLLLMLVESRGAGQLVPDFARASGAEAVLLPVDFEERLPAGLQNQIRSKLENREITVVMPEPFCSLTAAGIEEEFIKKFARQFGRPEVDLDFNEGEIENIEVIRTSPCGGTCYVASELPPVEKEDAARQAGLIHQYFPCLASVDLIHKSAYLTEAAVKRALAAGKEDQDR